MNKALKLIDKVNISHIVKNHFQCFKNSSGWQYYDLALFLVFPFAFAVGVEIYTSQLDISKDFISTVINVMAITIGLLMNLLVLLYTLNRKTDDVYQPIVLRQTVYSILYQVLVSLVILILSFTLNSEYYLPNVLFNGIWYYLLAHSVLNMLLIIKRMSRLVEFDMK